MTLLQEIEREPTNYNLEQQASIASMVMLGILDDEDNFVPEMLGELNENQLRAIGITAKRLLLIQPLLRQRTLHEGVAGSGKSLAGVALMKMIKELCGMNIVVIGSKMDLNKNFGDYTFLDEKEFVENLGTISEVGKNTSDQELGNAVDILLQQEGVSIMNSCLVFDEAYKLFDARTPSDKLVRVFGYFIAQSRHYKTTIILMSPDRKDLDRRIRRQINWFGQCTTRNEKTTVVLRDGRESYLLKIHGPNYWGMYDTHALVGFRAKHLSFKEEQF